jgi:hypothetical protein
MTILQTALRRPRFLAAGCLLAGALALPGPLASRAAAADSEARDFAVKIDGKPSGTYTLTITRQDDGATTVTAQADVKFTVLGFVKAYTYAYQGTEVWKDGRLLRLESTCNDDGKQHAVSAVAEGGATKVKADGREHTTRPDVWTTSYWHLADVKFRNQSVPLLEASDGKDIPGMLQYAGILQLPVSGHAEDCVHYHVGGDKIHADLWYDKQERLVRQKTVEGGHETLLELVRIRK